LVELGVLRVSGLDENESELLMNEGAGILKIEGSVVMGVSVGVGAEVVGATDVGVAVGSGATKGTGAGMVGATLSFMGRVRGLR
jgi:hypothetical protein